MQSLNSTLSLSLFQIIRNNGFLNGLYTDEELSSENIKNKEAKIQFLQKTIDSLSFITNRPLDQIKAGKIVAGLEPEHTNELLQILGKCVISRKESSLAVKRVLKGERPGTTNLSLSVTDDLPFDKEPPAAVRKKSISTTKTNEQKLTKQPIKQSTASTSTKTTTGKLGNKTTSRSTTNLAKSPIKSSVTNSTAVQSKKPTIRSSSTPKSSSQQTKVTTNKAIAPKSTATTQQQQQNAKRGQEKIAKPVAKPPTKAIAINKRTNQVSKTNEANRDDRSISGKNRTLTKHELDAIQAAKQNRAEDEENKAALLESEKHRFETSNGESNNDEMTNETTKDSGSQLDAANESASMEPANQTTISESITDHSLNKAENQELHENQHETKGK